MKLLTFSFFAVMAFSCSQEKKEAVSLSEISKDSLALVVKNKDRNVDMSESYTIYDTIRVSKEYYFSSSKNKDFFVLTIMPGLIKDSKSELKIVTYDGRDIYKQVFRSSYFIRRIDQPDTIPSGGQEVYDNYIEQYRKSLTKKDYEVYIRKNIDSFFGAGYPIDKEFYKDFFFDVWADEIADKDFLSEAYNDSTINLVDIACFDREEGAMVIGYSRRRNKLITLLEHD
jgi:hypothetical protein